MLVSEKFARTFVIMFVSLAVVFLFYAVVQIRAEQNASENAKPAKTQPFAKHIGWVQVLSERNLAGHGILLMEYRVRLKGDPSKKYADHFERNVYAPLGVSNDTLMIRSVQPEHGLPSKEVYITRYQGPGVRGVGNAPLYFVKAKAR